MRERERERNVVKKEKVNQQRASRSFSVAAAASTALWLSVCLFVNELINSRGV